MANMLEGEGEEGEISVSFDTLNGANLHITDAKIPPWPPPPSDERGEFDRKSSYLHAIVSRRHRRAKTDSCAADDDHAAVGAAHHRRLLHGNNKKFLNHITAATAAAAPPPIETVNFSLRSVSQSKLATRADSDLARRRSGATGAAANGKRERERERERAERDDAGGNWINRAREGDFYFLHHQYAAPRGSEDGTTRTGAGGGGGGGGTKRLLKAIYC